MWSAGIMGLGATFGALNTMYSAVSARRREDRKPCAPSDLVAARSWVSVMTEALLFCLAGAAVGIVFAWLLFGGYQHAMGGLVIRLAVTARLALTGVCFLPACSPLSEDCFPAIRAARLSVADALRAT